MRLTEEAAAPFFFCFFGSRLVFGTAVFMAAVPRGGALYLTVILLCQPESLLLAARPGRSPTGGIRGGAGVCLLVCFGCACVLVCLPRGKQNGTYRHDGRVRACACPCECVFVRVCSRAAHCRLTKPFRCA